MRKLIFAVILLTVLAVTCAAQDTSLKLQYAPKVGDVLELSALGKLADIQMNGMSLGISGQMTGLIKMQITAVSPENGDVTVHLAFSDLKAEFSGQPRTPKPLDPIDMKFSSSGEMLEISAPPATEEQMRNASLDALTNGGLPLDAIASFALFPRFPAEAVKVGDAWQVDMGAELPLAGEVKLSSTTKLAKLDTGKAALETVIASDLAGFEMPNPLMPGGKIKIKSGKVVAERIERSFDPTRSLVTSAKGALKVDLVADMGLGIPMPLGMTAEFLLEPPKPAAPAQTAPAQP
jgi:hypothetical protein